MNAENANNLAGALRELDRDRYFATLVVPPAHRPAVQSLYAFSAEIAAVRERAREPMPGEIRLQWWTDALSGPGHGEVGQNPLAAALLDTVAKYRLPTQPLLRLVEARRFDLYDDPMPDLPTFEGYAGETVSVLYQLAAMVLNDGEPADTADAAGHLGVAQALIGHLRAFGYNAAHGRIFLPWSIFAANGVGRQAVLAGIGDAGLFATRAQLVDIADTHLVAAEAAVATIPRRLRPVFAPTAILRGQLRGLRRAADAPFALPREASDLRKLSALILRRWV